jgi:hypothetical protein
MPVALRDLLLVLLLCAAAAAGAQPVPPHTVPDTLAQRV